jgi:raffinose/stachyose/melibiose transport system permease protein
MEWLLMDKMLRKGSTVAFFISPALILYSAIVFLPILASVYFSFFEWDILSPPEFTGFGNYIRMVTDDDVFFPAIWNMLFLLGTSLVFQLTLGFFLAVLLTGKVIGKEFYKNVFFMPAVLSSVAVGMMWTFIYDPKIGIINTLLHAVGLDSLERLWLSNPHTAMWAISVVVSWQFVGNYMVLFIAAIKNISEEILEAACLDGAIGWKLVWYITIPLVKPIIKVCIIMISVGSLKFFDLIFVMTGGGPANATEVLASHLYKRSFQQLEYGYGDALSVVLMVLCLIVTVLINKFVKTSDFEE